MDLILDDDTLLSAVDEPRDYDEPEDVESHISSHTSSSHSLHGTPAPIQRSRSKIKLKWAARAVLIANEMHTSMIERMSTSPSILPIRRRHPSDSSNESDEMESETEDENVVVEEDDVTREARLKEQQRLAIFDRALSVVTAAQEAIALAQTPQHGMSVSPSLSNIPSQSRLGSRRGSSASLIPNEPSQATAPMGLTLNIPNTPFMPIPPAKKSPPMSPRGPNPTSPSNSLLSALTSHAIMHTYTRGDDGPHLPDAVARRRSSVVTNQVMRERQQGMIQGMGLTIRLNEEEEEEEEQHVDIQEEEKENGDGTIPDGSSVSSTSPSTRSRRGPHLSSALRAHYGLRPHKDLIAAITSTRIPLSHDPPIDIQTQLELNREKYGKHMYEQNGAFTAASMWPHDGSMAHMKLRPGYVKQPYVEEKEEIKEETSEMKPSASITSLTSTASRRGRHRYQNSIHHVKEHGLSSMSSMTSLTSTTSTRPRPVDMKPRDISDGIIHLQTESVSVMTDAQVDAILLQHINDSLRRGYQRSRKDIITAKGGPLPFVTTRPHYDEYDDIASRQYKSDTFAYEPLSTTLTDTNTSVYALQHKAKLHRPFTAYNARQPRTKTAKQANAMSRQAAWNGVDATPSVGRYHPKDDLTRPRTASPNISSSIKSLSNTSSYPFYTPSAHRTAAAAPGPADFEIEYKDASLQQRLHQPSISFTRAQQRPSPPSRPDRVITPVSTHHEHCTHSYSHPPTFVGTGPHLTFGHSHRITVNTELGTRYMRPSDTTLNHGPHITFTQASRLNEMTPRERYRTYHNQQGTAKKREKDRAVEMSKLQERRRLAAMESLGVDNPDEFLDPSPSPSPFHRFTPEGRLAHRQQVRDERIAREQKLDANRERIKDEKKQKQLQYLSKEERKRIELEMKREKERLADIQQVWLLFISLLSRAQQWKMKIRVGRTITRLGNLTHQTAQWVLDAKNQWLRFVLQRRRHRAAYIIQRTMRRFIRRVHVQRKRRAVVVICEFMRWVAEKPSMGRLIHTYRHQCVRIQRFWRKYRIVPIARRECLMRLWDKTMKDRAEELVRYRLYLQDLKEGKGANSELITKIAAAAAATQSSTTTTTSSSTTTSNSGNSPRARVPPLPIQQVDDSTGPMSSRTHRTAPSSNTLAPSSITNSPSPSTPRSHHRRMSITGITRPITTPEQRRVRYIKTMETQNLGLPKQTKRSICRQHYLSIAENYIAMLYRSRVQFGDDTDTTDRSSFMASSETCRYTLSHGMHPITVRTRWIHHLSMDECQLWMMDALCHEAGLMTARQQHLVIRTRSAFLTWMKQHPTWLVTDENV